MKSPRDIRRQIRAVRNIQQICRAMKTVSSIKLRKAEERILAARPYAEALQLVVSRLSGVEYSHPLLETREEIRHTGVVAISGDKGLAGSYNANLVREASALVREEGAGVVAIGRKVADAFRRQQFETETALSPRGDRPEFPVIAVLADHLGELYSRHAWDRVLLVYTEFGGRVVTRQLLPIVPPEGEEAAADFLYEPSAGTILEHLLPRYLRTVLFTAVLSAVAAEHAARVAAMSLATDNAEDLISQLTMDYNKSRQASITRELTDIVGAAEALRG